MNTSKIQPILNNKRVVMGISESDGTPKKKRSFVMAFKVTPVGPCLFGVNLTEVI